MVVLRLKLSKLNKFYIGYCPSLKFERTQVADVDFNDFKNAAVIRFFFNLIDHLLGLSVL